MVMRGGPFPAEIVRPCEEYGPFSKEACAGKCSMRSQFHQCALASELVSRADLEAAVAELRASGGGTITEATITDRQLADKLVEMGRLNSYQANRLLAGESSFRLGPYVILDSIGQRGMGHGFKAEHPIMGRIVAIKALPKSKSTPTSIASFMREIRA